MTASVADPASVEELAELDDHDDDGDDWEDDTRYDAWDRAQGADTSFAAAKSSMLAHKFESLESLGGAMHTAGFSQAAGNSLSRTERKLEQSKHTGLTRDERATTDQVLDPRTRLILFKMINSGQIEAINGCVSTGKEANVYHAFGPDCELAVKVYKTSILIFKVHATLTLTQLIFKMPCDRDVCGGGKGEGGAECSSRAASPCPPRGAGSHHAAVRARRTATVTCRVSSDSVTATVRPTRAKWSRCGRKRKCATTAGSPSPR